MTSYRSILINLLSELYNEQRRLTVSKVFDGINRLPKNGVYYFYIKDFVYWINEDKTIISNVITSDKFDEGVAERIMKLSSSISIKEFYPPYSQDNQINSLSVCTYSDESITKFGVDLITGDSRIIQKGMIKSEVKSMIEFIRHNKPLPKKMASGGFSDRLAKISAFRTTTGFNTQFSQEFSNGFSKPKFEL